jgi:hypothetical protein
LGGDAKYDIHNRNEFQKHVEKKKPDTKGYCMIFICCLLDFKKTLSVIVWGGFESTECKGCEKMFGVVGMFCVLA